MERIRNWRWHVLDVNESWHLWRILTPPNHFFISQFALRRSDSQCKPCQVLTAFTRAEKTRSLHCTTWKLKNKVFPKLCHSSVVMSLILKEQIRKPTLSKPNPAKTYVNLKTHDQHDLFIMCTNSSSLTNPSQSRSASCSTPHPPLPQLLSLLDSAVIFNWDGTIDNYVASVVIL